MSQSDLNNETKSMFEKTADLRGLVNLSFLPFQILFKSYLKADGNTFRAAGSNSESHSNLNLLYNQILCITFFKILFKSDLKELVDIYIQEETTSNFIHI